MSKVFIEESTLTAIGDAIRAKTGKTGMIPPLSMPSEIENIQGSSDVSANVKDVNFYDYDGTLLHSYTVAEAADLTKLPDLPSHSGLICQGWNWTLDSIKAVGHAVNVCAVYITDDGKTRLNIKVWDLARSNVSLYISQTVANGVTIDWGDGSELGSLNTTGYVNATHKYAAVGNYTILLDVTDGCTLGFGHNSSSFSIMGSTGDYGKVYCNLLQSVRIGKGVTSIGSRAFNGCYSLASITIPDSVTSIGSYAFNSCYSLASITIPDSVTSIGSDAFYNCYSLANITIPDSVASIGSRAFYNCCGMAEYHIRPTIPPTLSNVNAFSNIPSDCVIYVPQGCLEAYQNATNWTQYADYMQEELV